jgi:hypothetical protein
MIFFLITLIFDEKKVKSFFWEEIVVEIFQKDFCLWLSCGEACESAWCKRRAKTTKKIIAPKLAFQGNYLYDKGENDELVYVNQLSTTDLQIHFNTNEKKSKEKFQKNFFMSKFNSFPQKMLKRNKFTKNSTIFTLFSLYFTENDKENSTARRKEDRKAGK